MQFYLFYPFFFLFFCKRNFSMPINSAAVLQLTLGRGGGGGTAVGSSRNSKFFKAEVGFPQKKSNNECWRQRRGK